MMETMAVSNKVSANAKEVAAALLEIGSISFNFDSPYTWVSGIKSPVYCDNRRINSNVQVRKTVVDAFHKLVKESFPEVEVIAGMATGGIPCGVLLAERMNLPFIYVRSTPKEHGLKRQVEGSFNPGEKVVLIEDHISTGGSSLKGINGLREEGLNLIGLVSIMTYGFDDAEKLFADSNVNNMSLCDLDTIVDVAYGQGTVTDQNKDALAYFRSDPHGWA